MKKLLLFIFIIVNTNAFALQNFQIRNSDGSQSWGSQDSMGNITIQNSNGSQSWVTHDNLGNTTIRNSDGSQSYVTHTNNFDGSSSYINQN